MLQTTLSTALTPSIAYQVYCLAIVTKNRRVRVIARRDALGYAVTEFSPSVYGVSNFLAINCLFMSVLFSFEILQLLPNLLLTLQAM